MAAPTTRGYASTPQAATPRSWLLSMETGSASRASASLLRLAEQAPAAVESTLSELVEAVA
jgi:hypothetical protein